MLVEDDNSLREIYQARLMAEGYQTVTAKDGEEALALVGQEKPDLIILDVMMPKISGFDTLDILRSTPATQATKVIMMSALSQAEDKTRAEKLGANKYLVKSQVTLEDIVKAVKEILGTDQVSSGANDLNISAPVAVEVPSAPVQPVVTVEPPTPTSVPIDFTTPTEPVVTPTNNIVTEPLVADQPVVESPAVPEVSGDFTSTTSVPEVNSVPVVEEPVVSGAAGSDVSSDPSPLNDSAVPAAPVVETVPESTAPISGSDIISSPLSSSAPVVETPVEVTPAEPQQIGGTKIVTPLSSATADPKSRLDELLAAEAAKESTQANIPPAPQTPPVEPTQAV
jgi:CheY-like chemotaxis protein